MKLALSETINQKRFLEAASDDTKAFYKIKFRDFNISASLSHDITKILFNLINKEIIILKSQLYPLEESYYKLSKLRKDKRKELLLAEKSRLLNRLYNNPLLLKYYVERTYQDQKNEFKFLMSKFNTSMNLITLYSSLYEEFYIINSLHVSASDWFLTYCDESFKLTKGSTHIEFQTGPVFFIIKKLLDNNISNFNKKMVLEYILTNNLHPVPYLLTISDDKVIDEFYSYCTMSNLSDYTINKLDSNESILLPKILNISQLPL